MDAVERLLKSLPKGSLEASNVFSSEELVERDLACSVVGKLVAQYPVPEERFLQCADSEIQHTADSSTVGALKIYGVAGQ